MGDYTDYASFFIPDLALFGGFPNQEQTNELMKMGVTHFVDLTFPDEVPVKYKLNEGCYYISFPIPDRKVPINVTTFTSFVLLLHETLKNLPTCKKLYLHCKGGHGRSGLVVAILLCLYYGNLSTTSALEMTNESHNQRKIMREKWRRIGAPQTFYQKKYVHKFFSDLVYFRAYRSGSTTGFSNYSFHDVNVENDQLLLPPGNFPTSEALFQASKKPDDSEYILKQESSRNPRVAKKLGERIIPSEEWNEKRYEIMKQITKLKLEQHPQILANLTRTGQRNIIYNSRRDNFFGVGDRGTGANLMGIILMEARNARYREFSPTFKKI